MLLSDGAVYERVSIEPGAPVPVTASLPFAFTGREGFVLGHEVMNWDARVYTELRSSGVCEHK